MSDELKSILSEIAFPVRYSKVNGVAFIIKSNNNALMYIDMGEDMDAFGEELARLINTLDPKRESVTVPKATDVCDISTTTTVHRCPICNGNGLVPNGFYNQTSGMWSTSAAGEEPCRSCDGKGVIKIESLTSRKD